MSDRPETPLEQCTLELWTSNSFRRFKFREGGAACEPIAQPCDGHPDLYFPGGFEGPVARRFLSAWNAVKGISTAHLDAIQKAPRTLAMIFHDYISGVDERAELLDALAKLYDAVQRGDFDIVGVERSDECLAAISVLKKNGSMFDQYLRRTGALDKHGNVTP